MCYDEFRMKFIEFNGWRYCWTTVAYEKDRGELEYPDDKPYASWVEKPNPVWVWNRPRTQVRYELPPSGITGHHLKKVTYFKTRASARRSAKRQRETHEFRNKGQAALRESGYIAPRYRCSNCETAPKAPGDYLCEGCRFG